MTFPAKNIGISINCPKDTVYQFASDPEHLPQWLAFVKSVSRKSGTSWHAVTAPGEIEIEFPLKNDFGVIDHIVKLPDGTKVSNPLRVIGNHDGSEVVFTLFKMPGKTDADFEEDIKLVQADLLKLKEILESK